MANTTVIHPTRRSELSEQAWSEVSRQETATLEAKDIAILLQWINDARHFLDSVQLIAKIDEVFAERLREHDLRDAIDWDDDQANAMTGLFYELISRIESIHEPRPAVPEHDAQPR